MTNVLAVNGSPNRDKGMTAMLLASFIAGMERAGAGVEVVYPSSLTIKRCDCGHMHCWNRTPGSCPHKDDMDQVYPRLKQADVLVLATPMYVPLPGAMQDFVNRMTPLLDPVLETRDGRTRAKYREDVRIRKLALVADGGWWEKENLDTLVRIAQELAEVSSIEFAGAVLRPHVHAMLGADGLNSEGQAVSQEIEQAGYELIDTGKMNPTLLAGISRPLVSREDLLRQLSD